MFDFFPRPRRYVLAIVEFEATPDIHCVPPIVHVGLPHKVDRDWLTLADHGLPLSTSWVYPGLTGYTDLGRNLGTIKANEIIHLFTSNQVYLGRGLCTFVYQGRPRADRVFLLDLDKVDIRVGLPSVYPVFQPQKLNPITADQMARSGAPNGIPWVGIPHFSEPKTGRSIKHVRPYASRDLCQDRLSSRRALDQLEKHLLRSLGCIEEDMIVAVLADSPYLGEAGGRGNFGQDPQAASRIVWSSRHVPRRDDGFASVHVYGSSLAGPGIIGEKACFLRTLNVRTDPAENVRKNTGLYAKIRHQNFPYLDIFPKIFALREGFVRILYGPAAPNLQFCQDFDQAWRPKSQKFVRIRIRPSHLLSQVLVWLKVTSFAPPLEEGRWPTAVTAHRALNARLGTSIRYSDLRTLWKYQNASPAVHAQ
ncbi:hypothetical protein C8R45DRAFT_1072422 [Mycena sanguinolenta]|nr:hypothetical protein C8R45DRAFT_1072422 [Mycena sanguinolenta]